MNSVAINQNPRFAPISGINIQPTGANMIYSTAELESKYKPYSDVKGKIMRLTREGKLIKITRGLYEDDPEVNPSYLAIQISDCSHRQACGVLVDRLAPCPYTILRLWDQSCRPEHLNCRPSTPPH